jgi:hypothetical protein
VLRATDATLPIICLQSSGSITREDIQRVMPLYDRAYARRQPFIAINDVRLANFDAQQRKLWGEWTAHSAKHDPGATKATIMIMESPLMRGALTALNWIAMHKIPQHAVADALEAIELGKRYVEKEGLHVKPETWGQVRYWIDQGHALAVVAG